MDQDALVELGKRRLLGNYKQAPVVFVEGSGSRLTDKAGRTYLDFTGGVAVNVLGHAHPRLASAIAEQAKRVMHVSNYFYNEENVLCADELCAVTGMDRAFFCNSGAEANEAAIKLARKWGGYGRHAVVSAYGSFHGRTLATLHATGQPEKHETFQPLPEGFRHAEWNDLDALEAAIDPTVAAVLLEPVQGEGGVNPATAEYFRGVRRLCDERGLLFMVDEVQTGLGRTGEWFGHQHFGVVPDVVTMAKALGNGVPIGACWAKRDVARAFEPGDHATTYGGQPLAAAAARAVLAVMEASDVPARATAAGARLTGLLQADPRVSEVRGLGLLLAAQLVDGIDARAVATAALERGLVVNAVTPTALRLAPSLLITDDELDEAMRRLAQAFADVEAAS